MKSLPSVISKHIPSSVSIYRTNFDLGTSIHVHENSGELHSRSNVTASCKKCVWEHGKPKPETVFSKPLHFTELNLNRCISPILLYAAFRGGPAGYWWLCSLNWSLAGLWVHSQVGLRSDFLPFGNPWEEISHLKAGA